MKIAFILSCLIFSNSLFSQNNLAKQIRQIIGDTANHFQKFKGTVREVSDTESTYFNSTIILEGTKENWITNHRSICSYDASIADSVTRNQGMKILNTWKLKLMSILGSGYKLTELNPPKDSQFIVGWQFSKNELTVSVDLAQYFFDKSLYGVRLFIFNEHPRPR